MTQVGANTEMVFKTIIEGKLQRPHSDKVTEGRIGRVFHRHLKAQPAGSFQIWPFIPHSGQVETQKITPSPTREKGFVASRCGRGFQKQHQKGREKNARFHGLKGLGLSKTGLLSKAGSFPESSFF
jgi:hypothetical protein